MIKYFACLCILFFCLLTCEFTENSNELVVIYTSNINGSIRDCGCAGVPLGGFARLKSLIESYKKKYSTVKLIDTGDAYTSFPYDEKNIYISQLMGELGYDFILKADQELLHKSILPDSIFNQENEWFDTFIPTESYSDLFNAKQPSQIQLNDRPFLIFHGDSSSFQTYKNKLTHKFVFLSHSQETVFSNWEGQYLFQSGNDLERVGVAVFSYKNEKYDLVSHTFIPLDEKIKEEPQLKAAIDFFFSTNETIRYSESNYSEKNCQSCHQEAYQQWKDSKHAHALETLKFANKLTDSECATCHTTSIGTHRIEHVQCIACHTQAKRPHWTESKPVFTLAKHSCTSCHTSKNSPDFVLDEYLKKIKHWN